MLDCGYRYVVVSTTYPLNSLVSTLSDEGCLDQVEDQAFVYCKRAATSTERLKNGDSDPQKKYSARLQDLRDSATACSLVLVVSSKTTIYT